MRLICPNCGAQYEIGEGLIPEAGRDVQCSNCGHTWFETPGASEALELAPPTAAPAPEDLPDWSAVPDPAPAAETPAAEAPPAQAPSTPPEAPEAAPDSPSAEAPSAAPVRRAMDPDVADILREEAAFTRAARTADQIESQPELGLAAPEPRRIDHSGAGSRKDLLPDIEEINSSLRSDAETTAAPRAPQPDTKRSGRGFWRGFFFIVILALLAALIYVFAPQIAAQIPDQAQPYLTRYVEAVDALRLRLDLGLQSLLEKTGG